MTPKSHAKSDTLKNDEKPAEELACCFKIDIRKLTNFDSTTRKSQKFLL